MKDAYFVLRSVTYAQRARQVLEREGIPAAQLRSPRQLSPKSCAYALRVRADRCDRALRLLDRSGLPYEGPWLQRPDGSFEVYQT